MKNLRLIAAAGALLMLCGCMDMLAGVGGMLLGGGGPAPQAVQTASAPLARIEYDESAYRTALAGANTLRLSINVIQARGGLVRNSPSALRVRQGLVALRDSLRAGRALLDALNSPVTTLSVSEIARKASEYRAAMAAAATAAEEIGEAISGGSASAAEVNEIMGVATDIREALAEAEANQSRPTAP